MARALRQCEFRFYEELGDFLPPDRRKRSFIHHFDGTTWSSTASGSAADLHAVWAGAASDAIAVGAAGTILRWDGAVWFGTNLVCDTPGVTIRVGDEVEVLEEADRADGPPR